MHVLGSIPIRIEPRKRPWRAIVRVAQGAPPVDLILVEVADVGTIFTALVRGVLKKTRRAYLHGRIKRKAGRGILGVVRRSVIF